MRRFHGFTKDLALGLGLLCATAAWTSTASADHGHRRHQHHRNRHTEVVFVGGPACASRPYVPSYPVVSGPPPVRVIAVPTRSRVYYDPYCHRSFADLNIYYAHVHRHRHGSVAWVVEGGVPLYGYRWAPDGWLRFGFDFAVAGR